MKLLTSNEVAEQYGTTRQRVMKAIDRGELKAVRRQPVILIEEKEAARWGNLPKSRGGYPKGRPRKERGE